MWMLHIRWEDCEVIFFFLISFPLLVFHFLFTLFRLTNYYRHVWFHVFVSIYLSVLNLFLRFYSLNLLFWRYTFEWTYERMNEYDKIHSPHGISGMKWRSKGVGFDCFLHWKYNCQSQCIQIKFIHQLFALKRIAELFIRLNGCSNTCGNRTFEIWVSDDMWGQNVKVFFFFWFTIAAIKKK